MRPVTGLFDRLSHATDAQIAAALITAETVGLALIWLGHHLNRTTRTP